MVAVVRAACLPTNYGIPTPLHIWAVIYKHSICRGPISDNSSLESVGRALKKGTEIKRRKREKEGKQGEIEYISI